jgi:DNA damage-binding protein 1
MAYSYVVTSQKPTAVFHSLVCSFTSSVDRNLVIARGNHIEIHTFREDGLSAEFDVPLFGKIASLDSYRPHNLDQDLIFILTEKKHFCILGYDAATKKLVTRASGNVKDRVGRDIESGQRAFIDPDNRVIGMLLYEGLLKVSHSNQSLIIILKRSAHWSRNI